MRRGCASIIALATLAGACNESGVCGGKELALEVSGNHGHDERIAARALAKGPGRYALAGGSHEHTFRLSEADLATLAKGDSVELRTTSMNAHLHELRVRCAK